MATGLQSNWRGLTAAALAASLAHVLIDFHIGLFGSSSLVMSGWEACAIISTALAYGAWTWVLAQAKDGDRTSLASVLAFAGIWSFLSNGLIAVIVAPPPSAAFPYQDLAHFSNILLGGLASYSLWRAMRAAPPVVRWRFPAMSVIGILLLYVGQNLVIAFK
jgi:hypothetical protein